MFFLKKFCVRTVILLPKIVFRLSIPKSLIGYLRIVDLEQIEFQFGKLGAVFSQWSSFLTL